MGQFIIINRNRGGQEVYLKGFYAGDARYCVESDAKVYTDKELAKEDVALLNDKYSKNVSRKHELIELK